MKSGGRGAQCSEDDALDVLLKTVRYDDPTDRRQVERRRSQLLLERGFFSIRSCGIPESIDLAFTDNQQLASLSEKLCTTEPVLAIARNHGISAWKLAKESRSYEQSKDVINGLIELIAKLHRAGWSCSHIDPEEILVDSSGSLRLRGTSSYWPIANGRIAVPPGDDQADAPWIAPEVRAGAGDLRADLFTWAAIVVFILTGQPGTVGAEILDPRIPVTVATTLTRCLSADPDDRPDSADDLRAWFEEPPPRRPRWAVAIHGGPKRGTARWVVSPGSDSLEILRGAKGGVVHRLPPATREFELELNAGSYVRTVSLSGEKRSGLRGVISLDLDDASSVQDFVREGSQGRAMSDPVAAVLRVAGVTVWRHVARSADPLLRELVLSTSPIAVDAETLVSMAQSDPVPELRWRAAVCALRSPATSRAQRTLVANVVVPVEPWSAVEAVISKLGEVGIDRSWLNELKASREASRRVSCPECSVALHPGSLNPHLRSEHGYVDDERELISTAEWRDRRIRRLRNPTLSPDDVCRVWRGLEAQLGDQQAVQVLLDAGLSRESKLLSAVREASVAARIAESLLQGSGRDVSKNSQLAMDLLTGNVALTIEVALRLARSKASSQRSSMEVSATVDKIQSFAGLGLPPKSVEDALRAHELELWEKSGVCCFRGKVDTLAATLDAARRACRQSRDDREAASWIVAAAERLSGSNRAQVDHWRDVMHALLELRQIQAQAPGLDHALRLVPCLEDSPRRLETTAFDITVKESILPSADFTLRGTETPERAYRVSLSRPGSALSTVLVTTSMSWLFFAALFNQMMVGGIALGAFLGAMVALLRQAGSTDSARSILFIRVLQHVHEPSYDRLQGLWLMRLLTGQDLTHLAFDQILWSKTQVTVDAVAKGTEDADVAWPLVRALSIAGPPRSKKRGTTLARLLVQLIDRSPVPSLRGQARAIFAELNDDCLVEVLTMMAGEPVTMARLESIHGLARELRSLPADVLPSVAALHRSIIHAGAGGSVSLHGALATLRLIDLAGRSSLTHESAAAFACAFGQLFCASRDVASIVDELDQMLATAEASAWTLCTRLRALAAVVSATSDGALPLIFPRLTRLFGPERNLRGLELGLRKIRVTAPDLMGRLRLVTGFRPSEELSPSEWGRHAASPDLVAVWRDGVITATGVTIKGRHITKDPRPLAFAPELDEHQSLRLATILEWAFPS